MDNIRQISEDIENRFLSPFAVRSRDSKGRSVFEEECQLRTAYQRDRDRIIHSKSFRRLKHKTQVFLSPQSDHYRTRLTHTLEVSQIARTVSRALRLNEDLTEAIALGHDLGHTPFGHAGERALNELSDDGFTHYEQSVRVCNFLERGGEGLNLTEEVLDGILHHTKDDWASTLEGRVVRFSDRIAYINHDLDDAIRAGMISDGDIPEDIKKALGYTKSERIDSLVKSLVQNSYNKDEILMDKQTGDYYDRLHNFLFESVYCNPVAKAEETKIFGIIESIYNYLVANPDKLSGEYAVIRNTQGVKRAVTDYIAGMTDQFAISFYSEVFIPKSWKL